MNRIDLRLGLGLLLVAGGLLFLLQNFNIIPADLAWLWALVFGVVGLFFGWLFLSQRAVWWPLIPACVFLDLAVLVGVGGAWPALAERWGGAFFLLGLALPFGGIYLVNAANWWSLIPAGTLTTLGVVAGVSPEAQGQASGGVFFLGLGLTFLGLRLAPTPQGRQRWAIWPAIPLLLLGALLVTPFATLGNVVFPLALVAAGAYVLYRALRPRAG